MTTVRCVGAVFASKTTAVFAYEHVPYSATSAVVAAAQAKCKTQVEHDAPTVTDATWTLFNFTHDDAHPTHWVNRTYKGVLAVKAVPTLAV